MSPAPAAERVERLVIANGYSWTEPNALKPGEVHYYTARHGDRVSVTTEEAARGESLGGLADEATIEERRIRIAELTEELERLTGERAAAAAQVPPPILQPPPPPDTTVMLPPSITGVPVTAPLPADVGPIGPTNSAAAAAARAIHGKVPDQVTVEAIRMGATAEADRVPPADVVPGNTATDEQLAAYNVADTLAYLNQHPDELDRLDEAELARAKPRKGVLEAIEQLRSTRAAGATA